MLCDHIVGLAKTISTITFFIMCAGQWSSANISPREDAVSQSESGIPELPRLRPQNLNPIYSSRGFRLGLIIRLNNEGLPIWRYRYEGQMMLGMGTDQGTLYDNECYTAQVEGFKAMPEGPEKNAKLREAAEYCHLYVNPWSFSFFTDTFYEQYQQFQGGPVLTYYERPIVAPQALLTRSRDFLRGIWPVDPNIQLPPKKVAKTEFISKYVTEAKGIVPGLVISAILDDPIRKTYEILVQQGGTSNNFRALSVNDSDLFDYIVKCMLTGRIVRIEYVRLFAVDRPISWLRGYSTYYRVISVTLTNQYAFGQE